MGRVATKAVGNMYYEARMRASKWNDRLCSREGAAEALGVSIDVINNAERGLYKCMPVEIAVAMADEYNAPELLNHYCINECPIGKMHPISEEVLGVDRVTVKLLKALQFSQLDEIKDKLLDIAEDGEVADDELDDLQEVLAYLDNIAKSVSELKIIGEKALKGHGRKSG